MSAPLWTAHEAAQATGGQAQGDWVATGVSIDSRSLQPGDLFIALSDGRDGHDFAAHALARGAAAAMVSRHPPGVAPDAPLLMVDDVLAGLTALGAAGRARSAARVIAVTGSVGKTSTKEMLRVMLADRGRVHAAEASFNNHWGVPVTLARLPRTADFAIVEIGMNRPGEIAPLARLARPHVAMITTIAPAHLEAFDSIDGIAREKADVFAGLEPGGHAVFPADLPTSAILDAAARAAGARCWPFGVAPAPVGQTAIRHSDGSAILSARVQGTALHVRLDGAGAHFARNALGCLGVAAALDVDLALAAQGLGRWTPPAGRGAVARIRLDPVEPDSFTLIDDAFNANPASVAAALAVLASLAPDRGGRRIAILGDMLELGPEEAALHAALADDPAMASVDLVHCCGPRMAALWARLPDEKRGQHAESAETLGKVAHRLVAPGDIVLVKGSKASRVARVVDALSNLGQAAPGLSGEP